jgi:dihydroorotate dehydrogenase electron transfer subunit
MNYELPKGVYMLLCKAKILANERIFTKASFYLMELDAAELSEQARPGQFVMMTVAAGESPFLKRPMGINLIDRDSGGIRRSYQLVGQGPRAMSQLRVGERVEVLGPCGRGWKIDPLTTKNALLVGGGSGIATMLPLAIELDRQGVECDIVLGGQSAEHIICLEEFSQQGRIHVATEDGSLGEQGRIDLFFRDADKYDMVYACGPTPMMQKTADWAAANSLPCQVSLEERMGCGYGVCMGCVCEHKDALGGVSYQRVCREGPVFWAKEVF